MEVVPMGADVENSGLVTDVDWGVWTLSRNRATYCPLGFTICCVHTRAHADISLLSHR